MNSMAVYRAAGWRERVDLSGVTTASLLVVALVATGVGALSGLFLGGTIEPVLVAIAAGFLGTVAAGIVRNTLLVSVWGAAGVNDAGTPAVVVLYAAIASLAGSLSAYQLMELAPHESPVLIGALAGLLSSVLMGLLMVAYRMVPEAQD